MKRYTYSKANVPDDILSDAQLSHVNKTLLSILYKRGYQTPDEMKTFLFPDIGPVIHNTGMRDTDKAVELLASAIRNRDKIVVYRDYDCDGICAGAIAVECLRAIGADTENYANNRGIDGYGMCPAGIDNIMNQWPDTKIILTVDNGIVAHAGAARAKELGLTVIITDHHEPGDTLPDADAVIDPKRADETYGFDGLCGAGVIFKLMLALYIDQKRHIAPVMDTIDLVALATVADVVPLIGENRAIVKTGLDLINQGKRPFFETLLRKLETSNLNAHYGISFLMAPMVNSVSRLDEDTGFVVEMMLSDDETWLRDMADRLYDMNQERKDITARELEELEAELPNQVKDTDAAIIVRKDGLTEGIIGILAGKLKQKYNRPCIVCTQNGNGLLKGSARGCDGFELKSTLDKLPKGLLLAYGGHTKAAGITLDPAKYDEFRTEFMKLANETLSGKDFVETVEIDAVIKEDECTREFIQEMQGLEPFGEGFPPPLFGLVANPVDAFYMGENQKHVKYKTDTGLAVIQWNQGEAARKRSEFPKKFVGFPSLNVWKNIVSAQFVCDET